MLKELVISVVSGVIVAVILQMFGRGGRSGERSRTSAPRQTMFGSPPPPARRSGGGFGRFVLAVVGGLILAYAVAPMVLGALHGGGGGRGWGGGGRGRFYDGGGPGGYFDRGGDGIFGLPPLLVLTVVGTVIVWVLLSAMRRR
jgi:hypothetical protein